MGIRGAVKQGGGFWNNVDGTLQGVTFTNVPPGDDAEAGEWAYMVPEMLIDGADGPTTQHLFMGAADRYEFEDGGTEISGADGSAFTVGANTPAGIFINSLLDANPEADVESLLPDVEAGEPLTFDALTGARFRLKQQVDAEGTKKRGKRVVKQKDGTKKEYDRTNTIVINVYSVGGDAKPAGKAAGKAGKPAGKPAAAAKPGKAGDTAIRDKADAAVVALCEAAVDKKNPTGRIPTSKLAVGIIKQLAGDKQKDAVVKMAKDEEYLAAAAERQVFVYDADESTVELPE